MDMNTEDAKHLVKLYIDSTMESLNYVQDISKEDFSKMSKDIKDLNDEYNDLKVKEKDMPFRIIRIGIIGGDEISKGKYPDVAKLLKNFADDYYNLFEQVKQIFPKVEKSIDKIDQWIKNIKNVEEERNFIEACDIMIQISKDNAKRAFSMLTNLYKLTSYYYKILVFGVGSNFKKLNLVSDEELSSIN